MPTSKVLPRPTAEFVREKAEEFDSDNESIENTLTQLVAQFPRNTDLSQVIVKVAAVNSLYNTWIVGIKTVAKRIVSLNIDTELENGSAEIVNKIAQVQFGNKTRNNYSFAAKYCSWHKEEHYPIWDSRVDECLWQYRSRKLNQDLYSKEPRPFPTFENRSDLRNYAKFRQIVREFCGHFDLNFSFKQIDKFLFQLGNEYFPIESVRELNPDASINS